MKHVPNDSITFILNRVEVSSLDCEYLYTAKHVYGAINTRCFLFHSQVNLLPLIVEYNFIQIATIASQATTVKLYSIFSMIECQIGSFDRFLTKLFTGVFL